MSAQASRNVNPDALPVGQVMSQVDGEPLEEVRVSFAASDGWLISGSLSIPVAKAGGRMPGVVLVHASRHESDAFGNISAPGLPQTLARNGVAVLRIDVRGRGDSRGDLEFSAMGPEQRAAVSLDVLAAVKFLRAQAGVKKSNIAIVAEQDSASPTVIAASQDRHATAVVLISGRLNAKARQAITKSSKPILCLVSKEDRRGFRDMVDAYIASENSRSRIKVFEGLALGATMFATWRYDHSDKPPLENMVADWLTEQFKHHEAHK